MKTMRKWCIYCTRFCKGYHQSRHLMPMTRFSPIIGAVSFVVAHRLQVASHSGPERRVTEGLTPSLTSSMSRRTTSHPASNALVGISPGFTSLEHIIQWPILGSTAAPGFKDVVMGGDHIQMLFLAEAEPGVTASETGVPVTDGNEMAMLLSNFLRLVHVMNPVLDCKTLLAYGREVAELGPRWDAQTCLVVSRPALHMAYAGLEMAAC